MTSSFYPLHKDSPKDYVNRVESGLLKIRQKMWNSIEYGCKKSFTIRQANTGDSKRLAKLYQESFPDYPYPGLHEEEYHDECLIDKMTVRVVVDSNEDLIGAGGLGINPYCLLGELKQAVVHPNWRGNGIINALIGSRVEIAEWIGLEYIDTHARCREPGVQKSLLKHGFDPLVITKGIYPVHHSNGTVRENMILMRKYLNYGELRIDTKDTILPEIEEMLGL